MSTTILPFDRPSADPVVVEQRARTCGVSGTMTMMMSAWPATSLPLSHALPPASISDCGTLGMLYRNSSCPPLIRLAAIGVPMIPSPTNPILLMSVPSVVGDASGR
jgi:hypothetical protein